LTAVSGTAKAARASPRLIGIRRQWLDLRLVLVLSEAVLVLVNNRGYHNESRMTPHETITITIHDKDAAT